jgi:hypothetical protein
MTNWITAGGESFDELTGALDAIQSSFAPPNNTLRACYYFANGSTKQLTASLKGNRTRVWSKFYMGRNGQLGAGKPFLFYYDGANIRLQFSLVFVAGVGTCVKCETVNGATLATLFITSLAFFAETGNVSAQATAFGWMHIDVNYVGAGWVRVYRDNDLAGEFVGDPRVGGSTTVSDARIQNPNTAGSWAEAGFWGIIFGDEDTRGMKLSTLYLNANGDTNTFSSGNYTALDEQGEGGADFMESLVAGQKYVANCLDTPAVLGASPLVHSLVLKTRAVGAAAGSGGPTKHRQLVKTGGTEYQGASKTPSAVTVTLSTDTFTTNPGTGLAWTKAQIDAVQLGNLSEA